MTTNNNKNKTFFNIVLKNILITIKKLIFFAIL